MDDLRACARPPRRLLAGSLCLLLAIGGGCGEGADGTPASPADRAPPAGVVPAPSSPTAPIDEGAAPKDGAAAWPWPADTDRTRAARSVLVRDTIRARGVSDARVLAALERVPRHAFVPPDLREDAYADRPLAIGWDQTISQPYIVASMTEEARIHAAARVLEVGTGSGYQAAVLAEVASDVYTIEIKEALCRRAREVLRRGGYDRVHVRCGDGYHGWPEAAPFDAIIVTAAAPHVPPPLVRQLASGGRMVIPVGPAFAVQDLVLVTKDEAGDVRTRSLYAVRFVPLTGSLGESDD